jgi:hypothetical protein
VISVLEEPEAVVLVAGLLVTGSFLTAAFVEVTFFGVDVALVVDVALGTAAALADTWVLVATVPAPLSRCGAA